LPVCTTTDERNRVLGNIADEVLVILNSRPGLTLGCCWCWSG
jgi:hypothetical protein